MKRLIKRAFRPFWNLTGPIRRPIARKLDSRLNHMIAVAIRAQLLPTIQASLDSSARSLERLESSLGAANHSAHLMACDLDLMLGSVVREVARLQGQVDAIQDLVENAVATGRSGLALVERGGDGDWSTAVERSKVG